MKAAATMIILLAAGGWACTGGGNGGTDAGEEAEADAVEDGEDVFPDETPDPVFRCGDGVLDSGEECDDGTANSDIAPNACRTDCRAPWCGDAVRDDTSAEECDYGSLNSDERPGACRTDCRLARFCASKSAR